MQQVRLIGMSAMLAVLIWVVADQSLTATAVLSANIVPVSGGGADMHVTLLDPLNKPVELHVSGKKVTITALEGREPLTIRLRVSSRAPGEYDLQLLKELAEVESADLREVLIQDVRPPTLAVQVDRDRKVVMPVRVLRGSLDYEVAPVAEPNEVEVTISELAYNSLTPEQRCIELDPDEYLRTATRGVLDTKPVPLVSRIGNVTVQLDPDFVRLRFKLAEQLQEKTISAVPIKIESSLDIFNGFNVEVRDAGAVLTRPVTIRGRPALIERISAAGDVGFWGTISLTAADKLDPGRYRYVTPRFDLPEGVELTGEVEPVEFRLVPRGATAPATP